MNRGSAAKKTDWKTVPMPEQSEQFTMTRRISTEEMERLRRGNIPQGMEDKWFWYMEGNALYAHRSWTGYCVYILRFAQDSDEIRVTVNRDGRQYSGGGIREIEEAVNRLLDLWTRPQYDYYEEWLSETLRMLKKHGAAADRPDGEARDEGGGP